MNIDCSSVPDTLSVNITNIDDAGTVEVEDLSELRLACTDGLAQVGIKKASGHSTGLCDYSVLVS